jgi:hypothetical protein
VRPHHANGEKGVRVAQKTQVGLCIPVAIQSYKVLKLAQILLGQRGIFLTSVVWLPPGGHRCTTPS